MTGPVETSMSMDLLEFALRKMVEKNIGCLVIVDENKPVGIITERDISRCVLRSPEALKTSVGSVMSSPVIFLSPVAPIGEALETMLSYGIRRLPIVENGRLVGIVTDRDLLRYVVQIANEPKIPPEIKEILRKPLASKPSTQ